MFTFSQFFVNKQLTLFTFFSCLFTFLSFCKQTADFLAKFGVLTFSNEVDLTSMPVPVFLSFQLFGSIPGRFQVDFGSILRFLVDYGSIPSRFFYSKSIMGRLRVDSSILSRLWVDYGSITGRFFYSKSITGRLRVDSSILSRLRVDYGSILLF